jgi:hypothetical protein
MKLKGISDLGFHRIAKGAGFQGDLALALPGGLDNIERGAQRLKGIDDPERLLMELDNIQSMAGSLIKMIQAQMPQGGGGNTFEEPLVTQVGDAEVSTVLLDTRMTPQGEQPVYETMIFGGPRNGEGTRSGSPEEAQDYHDMMVAELQESM